MSSGPHLAAQRRTKLGLTVALLLSGGGLVAWNTMPREEDPRLEERFGLVVTAYPGADALTVERLVADPLEDHLAEVAEVRRVESVIRAGVMVTTIRLHDYVDAVDSAWDEVEEALDDAHGEFPEQALAPDLDRHLFDPESVVVAITGPSDVLALGDAAEDVRRRLLSVPHVSRVEVSGDPGEQITVELDDVMARRLGVDPLRLGGLLDGRNTTVPGGSLRHDGRRLDLRPQGEFREVAEVARTPVPLPSGAAVPLDSVARVQRMPREPLAERMRLDGVPAVAVGVVPQEGIDAIAFGRDVRAALDELRARYPALTLTEIAFQPDKVAGRLSELGGSLLLGIAIVAGVLFVTMGLRLGAVVASVVPLVTFAAVAVYALGGGVLHQIAVAALVIALGLLVDNAIVVAELVQRRIDEGLAPQDAAVSAVKELALPLGSATGTTIAAFLPMLLSEGPSADFTRAIPVVIVVTLLVSYAYALVVTPSLGALVIRRAKAAGEPGWLERFADRIGALSARRPLVVLGASLLAVLASGASALAVDFSFFPSSDREQLVVALELPEGTHFEETDRTARVVEAALQGHPQVRSVATFVGRSAPFFYYNLLRRPQSPHLAELVVTTDGPEAVTELSDFVRQVARRELPQVVAIPRRLEQGPPIPASVVVRLYGDDLDALSAASAEVRRLLREIDGVVDLRADEGLGLPTLRYEIDDAAAGRIGLARADIALALLGRTRGIATSTYRAGDDPIPIVVRSPQGEDLPLSRVDAVDVAAPGRPTVPVAQVARAEATWTPAVIHHRNRSRVTSVLSSTVDDVTYATVVGALVPRLEATEWPEGIRWEIGGATESSNESNESLAAKMPFGMLLLCLILLAEFGSFRRVGIVLATAPLAVMGIWPGLAIAGLSFGFVALLGALALIGIVVNGAIVLLDVTERRRAEGASIAEALRHAVAVRTRPILLTTATTIAGLLPLLFSRSTLWPPLSAAMISGLALGTVLTLFVVPALYRLLFRD